MFNKANTTYTVYRLFLVFFALVILFTASQAFAIHIYLKGGNVLVGKLPETLPFSTPKYNIKVKTNEIVSFRNGNLRLKNGSVLQKATIGLEELQVQTKFGNISIKVEEIEIIEEKIFVPTRNKEHNPTTNKYLVVTNKKGITLGGWNLKKGTRLTIVSEEGNQIKAMLGEDTFDIPRNGDVIRSFKIEDLTTPPKSVVGQGVQSLTALKKTIAVVAFNNSVPIAGGGEHALSRGMADQLSHALVKSGRFTVLSRGLFEEMGAERDIATTYSNIQGGSDGTIPWAQILIKGDVTEFDPGVKQSGKGYSFSGLSHDNTKAFAHVAVVIQVVNTSTGQVLSSQRVEGKAEEGGASINVNSNLLSVILGSFVPYGDMIPNVSTYREDFRKAPLGKATQLCIEKAVKYICQTLGKEPWQGTIIKLKGDKIYINSGASEGIKTGMIFCVCQGSALNNPLTGANLGMDLEEIGKLKVIKVKPKFSECFLLEGYKPEIGDFVIEMGNTRAVNFSEHVSGEDDDTVWVELEKLKRDKEEGRISDEEFNNLLEELVPGR
jgi:curli biogenesis system outer membrane secretion channel CsgG|tara:strand:- start:596 stop:2245 length:1650 start_codon:yes stop_codon:yes gene_type:complete